MVKLKLLSAIILILPITWLAWQAYDQSVRWGTSDPCGMVAERFRQEKIHDPAGWWRSSLTESMREDGALACWKSVLFDVPTESETRTTHVLEASDILRDWRSNDDDRIRFATLTTTFAGGDVIRFMLMSSPGEAAAILRAAVAANPSQRPDVEAAVAQYCSRLAFGKRPPHECVKEFHDAIGLADKPSNEGRS